MKTLIVIDMQNDFISGALANAEAEKTVAKTVSLVSKWEGEIIFTRDTHGDNYIQTEEGKNLPVPHCIKDTDGWQIRKEIYDAALKNKKATVKTVDKPSFGAGTLLYKAVISDEVPEKITFTGTCTDICVISNALILKSFLTETPMSVIEDLCSGVTAEKHRAAIDVMQSCQIAVEHYRD